MKIFSNNTMSAVIEDGGPAYPEVGTGADGDVSNRGGMSLRDYFAGQALAGCLADSEMVNDCFYKAKAVGATLEAGISSWSYRLADAMIAARKPPESP